MNRRGFLKAVAVTVAWAAGSAVGFHGMPKENSTSVLEATERVTATVLSRQGEVIQLGSVQGRENGNKGFWYTVGESIPLEAANKALVPQGERVTWWVVTPQGNEQVCSFRA